MTSGRATYDYPICSKKLCCTRWFYKIDISCESVSRMLLLYVSKDLYAFSLQKSSTPDQLTSTRFMNAFITNMSINKSFYSYKLNSCSNCRTQSFHICACQYLNA